MSITKNMPLNWYSSMKKKLRKIRIIFDVENWLWKSEIVIFPSLDLERRLIWQKKFLSLSVSWVKIVKNGKILTFKVNFLCQKLSESFSIFFSLKNLILGAHLLLLTFFGTFIFWTTSFSKMTFNFWRLLLKWMQDL